MAYVVQNPAKWKGNSEGESELKPICSHTLSVSSSGRSSDWTANCLHHFFFPAGPCRRGNNLTMHYSMSKRAQYGARRRTLSSVEPTRLAS
ncbi:unnamed protein product [Linum trigynum]|uniref:Uncharacterized protein n=1 Tax=Linum trigynum TaxID=586398 RepID=A0AAV2GY47_9ROSI